MSDSAIGRRVDRRAIYGPGESADYSLVACGSGWDSGEASRVVAVLQGLVFSIPVEGGHAFLQHPAYGHLYFRFQTSQRRDTAGRLYLLTEVNALSADNLAHIRADVLRIQMAPLTEPSDGAMPPLVLGASTAVDDAARFGQLLRTSGLRRDLLIEVVAALTDSDQVILAQELTRDEIEFLILFLPASLRGGLTFQSPAHQPPNSSAIPRVLMVPTGGLDVFGGRVVDHERRAGAGDEARTAARTAFGVANQPESWMALLEEWEADAQPGDFRFQLYDLLRFTYARSLEARGDAAGMIALIGGSGPERRALARRFLRAFPQQSADAALASALTAEDLQVRSGALEILDSAEEAGTDPVVLDRARVVVWSLHPQVLAGRVRHAEVINRVFAESLRRGIGSVAARLATSIRTLVSNQVANAAPTSTARLARLFVDRADPSDLDRLEAIIATEGWSTDADAAGHLTEWSAGQWLGPVDLESAPALLSACERLWERVLASPAGLHAPTRATHAVLSFLAVPLGDRAGWHGQGDTIVRDLDAALPEYSRDHQGRELAVGIARATLAWMLLRRVADGRAPEAAVLSAMTVLNRTSGDPDVGRVISRVLGERALAELLVRHGDSLELGPPEFRRELFVSVLTGDLERGRSSPGEALHGVVVTCGRMLAEGVYVVQSDLGDRSPFRSALRPFVAALARDGTPGNLRWVYASLVTVTRSEAVGTLETEFLSAGGEPAIGAHLWLLARSLAYVNRARELDSYERTVEHFRNLPEPEAALEGTDLEAMRQFTRTRVPSGSTFGLGKIVRRQLPEQGGAR